MSKDTIDVANFSFADILAPMTPEEFFRDYYDKKPLHIPGDASKFSGVMNWDVLNRLLNMSAIWSEKSLAVVMDRKIVAPPSYCSQEVDRGGHQVLRPIAAKVMELCQLGASLAINDIDTLTPEIAAVVGAFEQELTVKGQCNLYCSWQQRQAFQTHYDTHDVFAIHFEGEKDWRIWETRMPHPIQHPRYKGLGEEFDVQNRGKVLMDVTMKPGDLLYIPRGWYHDALSSSGGCIHIAFGMTGIIGLDMLSTISDVAVDREIFRENLPRASEGREALRERLKALASELSEIAESDAYLDAFQAYQDNWHYMRGGFDLPVTAAEKEFEITDPSMQVVQRGGQWGLVSQKGGVPIPPGYETPLKWVLNQKRFPRSRFTTAHAAMGIDMLDKFLEDLQAMQIIREAG